jgi:hypothetical protein
MPALKLADANYAERIRGSLGSSLIQISNSGGAVRSRLEQHTAIPGFDEWQEQWKSNNRLISQRLEMIDTELERLSREGGSNPQLNVFHDQEVTAGLWTDGTD